MPSRSSQCLLGRLRLLPVFVSAALLQCFSRRVFRLHCAFALPLARTLVLAPSFAIALFLSVCMFVCVCVRVCVRLSFSPFLSCSLSFSFSFSVFLFLFLFLPLSHSLETTRKISRGSYKRACTHTHTQTRSNTQKCTHLPAQNRCHCGNTPPKVLIKNLPRPHSTSIKIPARSTKHSILVNTETQ